MSPDLSALMALLATALRVSGKIQKLIEKRPIYLFLLNNPESARAAVPLVPIAPKGHPLAAAVS
jgi:hypothetical protein